MRAKKTFFQLDLYLVIILLIATIILPVIVCAERVFASTLMMSPMYEKISLNPGESYTNSFIITTPSTDISDFDYEVYVQSYYRDENNNAIFDDVNGHGQMAEWITLNTPTTGVLAPDDYAKISFTINVPENAPAGGQYAVITVGSDSNVGEDEKAGINVRETVAIAYTIYAEINGVTIRQGEINDVHVPSFILDGNITGSSFVRNNGNVHDDAVYTLQVYPLFSNEELYTNEEDPEAKIVLPDRTLYHETIWENTPAVGVFHVIYTVAFEDENVQLDKIVIKCPLWLLFIILFVVVALVIWLVLRIRARKNGNKKQR